MRLLLSSKKWALSVALVISPFSGISKQLIVCVEGWINSVQSHVRSRPKYISSTSISISVGMHFVTYAQPSLALAWRARHSRSRTRQTTYRLS